MSLRLHHSAKAVFFGLLLFLVSSCGNETPEAKVIGNFSCTRLARSFIQDQESVTFLDVEGGEPGIRSFTTNLDQRIAESGNRLSFASDGNFSVEFVLEAIPERSFFATAFGIPREDAVRLENLSAEYGILVNGTRMAGKKIESFNDPESQTWYGERINLSPLAGQSVKIRLVAKVNPADEGVIRGFADPRVMVRENLPWTDASPERPNIIVVLVDTLRADNLGCYGYARKTSPNLDAFASRALLYENAIAPSSWTWPSTASVLTGQYPFHHGVLDSTHCTLPLEKTTFAEVCTEAGMKTAAFVSNLIISRSRNFDQGFVSFRSMNWATAKGVVNSFAQWIEKVRQGRFMAYLHFIDPHSPYEPPDSYVARFSDPEDGHRLPESQFGKIRGQINTRSREPTRADRLAVENALDRYDAEILFWDEHFGRLLKILETKGLLENTLIAVTSDHGEEFLEHGYIGHGLTLFDTSLRVPLIIGGPGIRPGRSRDQVELISLMPTLLQIANIDPGKAVFDGPSLLEKDAFTRSRLAYSHTAHALSDDIKVRCDLFSLRTEDWKLHYYPGKDLTLLYELKSDLNEQRDQASRDDFKKTALQLRGHLQRWIDKYRALSPMVKYGSPSSQDTQGMDEETRKAFKELGYIGDY